MYTLDYTPSASYASWAALLFGVYAFIVWIQWFAVGRRIYMLNLTVGATGMMLGFALRIILHKSPGNQGLFTLSQILIFVSPCGFYEVDYLVLERLALHLGPETVAKQCLPIDPTWMSWLLSASDVVTVALQLIGVALESSNDHRTAEVGHKLALGGVITQTSTFLLYTATLLAFGQKVSEHFPEVWAASDRKVHESSILLIFRNSHYSDWRLLYYGLLFTCIPFNVRSGFRLVEFLQGPQGPITRAEGYLYLLDALPLYIGIWAFLIYWPPRFMLEGSSAESHQMADLRQSRQVPAA